MENYVCEACKRDMGGSCFVIIVDKANKITSAICPNCCFTDNLKALDCFTKRGEYVSEITGCNGAYKICLSYNFKISDEHCYYVTKEEAIRLLTYSLMPNEFKALLKNHNVYEFLLHDDFYTRDGLAWQPHEEANYINELTDYLSSHKLTAADRRTIQYYLDFLEDNLDEDE